MTAGAGKIERKETPKALILMYHRVAEVDCDPFSLSVSPRHFAEQVEVLRKHAHPLGLQELCGALRDGIIPPRSVALTFDDGYADNLEVAKPLLERHDIPATVFITTGFVDQARELWWDEIERIFLEPGTLPETLDLTIQGIRYRWQLGGSSRYSEDDCGRHRAWRVAEIAPTPRQSIYFSVWRLIQLLPEAERRAVLDQIAEWAGMGTGRRDAYRGLSAKEVGSLGQGGLVEIGAHTVTHPALPELSASAQRSEIQLSKARLEEILGRPVTSFAYPYGARSEASVAVVREAGFHCACATVAGCVEEGVDRFQLPRVQVNDWDGAEFEERLEAWFDAPRDAPIWGLPGAPEPVLIRGKWLFRCAGDNVARLAFPTDRPHDVRIEIERSATPASYDIQLNQPHLAVKAHQKYEVHFRARADRARRLSVGFAQAHEPWHGLGLYATIGLTPEWHDFQLSFLATARDDNGRIHFDVGASDIPIEVSAVSLRSLPGRDPVMPIVPGISNS
jgi:peptidoglycan/xylan/chitin deacetylase (PgdA/CDA1 family)